MKKHMKKHMYHAFYFQILKFILNYLVILRHKKFILETFYYLLFIF